ncbi:MAG: F0F1 ATP synthase subunit delta [Methyloprofundus sp.]|nr:F0F1 ATP synthase subunit delta [Methyloprofundus sp.]MDT8426704.1 F0F1 ATP synthase subunit delta [Methyloprofundus sp.]
MEFNLSTFSLEIINFLVLVWILQHLFYKPVRNIIAQRKQHIDQSLAEAAKMLKEAGELKKNYGNRLQEWNLEKQNAMAQLHQQMEAKRQQHLLNLQKELEQERSKNQAALQRQQQELQRHQQTLALQNGARFATLLLQQTAGAELEARLFDLLLSQLKQLPKACQAILQTTENEATLTIHVSSVYPLSESQRQQLEHKFTALIDKPLMFQYSLEPTLIAGLKIDKDAWVLHANLQHELSGFAEFADDF